MTIVWPPFMILSHDFVTCDILWASSYMQHLKKWNIQRKLLICDTSLSDIVIQEMSRETPHFVTLS